MVIKEGKSSKKEEEEMRRSENMDKREVKEKAD
jgi:hypothetical protein